MTCQRLLLSPTCWISLSILLTNGYPTIADDFLKFDVPATCKATETEQLNSGQKIVDVVVPVSLNLTTDSKISIRDFQVEIQWNQMAFQITQYRPRTTMQSNIVGNIKVEDRKDASASIGLDISSGYFDMVGGKAGLQAGTKNGKTIRYEETPKHNLLVTSGTIKRGTGVSFNFKPSRTTTLQGSRDLVIHCQVPEDWRGGILLVKCRATATRKFLGTFDDDLQQGSAFVVPVFLSGDQQARESAAEFVRTEQQLRSVWQRYQTEVHTDKMLQHWNSLVVRSAAPLPEHWVHKLIQASNDDWLEKYRKRLPSHIASSANEFVEARRELVKFGR